MLKIGSGAKPFLYSKGTRSSFPGVRWPWQAADHSLSPSTKVKNEYSYIPNPPLSLHGMDKDNFTFL
jgi:hypothetical protein